MDRINDPIYGLIRINPIESKIINCSIFQRLRDIKQLGLSYYVYPTATHNRFSHSIGVMHLADKIFTLLRRKYPGEYIDYLDDKALKNLRMAALLHDIGHFPFSHALEFSKDNNLPENLPFFVNKGHESLSKYLIENSYIKNILEEDDNYNIEIICGLITGQSTDNLILNNLIHWDLDADRLDYLLRDSYFTGVSFGVIDYNYLIENFEIIPEEDPYIGINDKAGRSIENVLYARYSLNDRIYLHKIIKYYEYLLKNLVMSFFNEIIPDFLMSDDDFKKIILDQDSTQFLQFTDTFILNKLHEKFKKLKNTSHLTNNLKNYKSDLSSLLFRKNNDEIFSYPYITKKKEIDMLGRFVEIEKILKNLDPNFNSKESKIRLNRPRNKITTFEKENYSIWNISTSDLEAIKEKEKGTIMVIKKSQERCPFYLWEGSFFNEIYEFNNFRTDIYIRKENPELIQTFKSDAEGNIINILND